MKSVYSLRMPCRQINRLVALYEYRLISVRRRIR